MKRTVVFHAVVFIAILFHLISSELFCQAGIFHSKDSLYLVTSFEGSSRSNQLESSCAIGDINGDSLADFVIRYIDGYAQYYEVPKGHSDLYYGRKDISKLKPDYIFKDRLVYPIGDVNRDGYPDIMTAEPDTAYPYYPHAAPIFRVFFGGRELDTVPKFFFKFKTYYWNMLYSAGENIGDINGDGYGDFMIGSPYNWSNGRGFMYVFAGGDSLSDIPILTLKCPEDSLMDADLLLGENMVGIGDQNNDGFDDFLVNGHTPSGEITRVYLYYGGNPLSDKPARIMTDSVFVYSTYGSEIRNAGDLNNDGHNDFMISGVVNAYIYLSLDSIITIDTRKNGGGYIGLGTGGDINGDGYNDFLVGNTSHLNSQGDMVGIADVFYGGSIIDTVERASMEGTGKWFDYGRLISIPGDINGDGYAEVLVHEPGWPDYNIYKSLGKLYLYSYKELVSKVDEEETAISSSRPEGFTMLQNYPNPFNPATTISYSIPHSAHVELKLYDMLGKEVMNLFNGEMPAGMHNVSVNAKGIPSGVYICRIRIRSEKASFEKSIKMTLLK